MRKNYLKPAKDLIRKTPIVNSVAKTIFQFAVKKQDKAQSTNYAFWLNANSVSSSEIKEQKQAAKLLQYRPLISIVVPTFNTHIKFFDEMMKSVISQTYDRWELIVVDDSSADTSLRVQIERYAESDERIKYKFLDKNHRIAGATNEGIKISSGEFISLLDHDDLLQPNALFEIAKALNSNKNLDFIYTDEDKISGENNERKDPFFKPDWNQDFLYSVNYITHLTTIRRSKLDIIGYEETKFDGAQDWELFLRATRTLPADKIHHIPKVLYSWRVHELSTAMSFDAKPYVVEAQRSAITSELTERGLTNFSLNIDDLYPGQWQLSFKPKTRPKISILVSSETADQARLHLQKNTSYPDYEVLTLSPDFSYEELLSRVSGDFIILIDRELNITDPSWLDLLLGDAERNDIGFVLSGYKANSDIEDIIGDMLDKTAFNLIKIMSRRNVAKHLYVTSRYNIRSIFGGVAMVKVAKLNEAITDKKAIFNLHEASNLITSVGYRNLYNPYVKVIK